MEKTRICIIGAGITGLAAAYRLLCRGYSVTVLESCMNPGGMISSFTMGWEKIEHIYHHIFTSDTYVTDLSEELGISDQISWYEPESALYVNDRLYPFSTPGDLLKLNAIPLKERIRTGMTVLKAKRISSYEKMEKITAKDWLISQSGENTFKNLWNPLLKSKFDDDASNVSAVWVWNKFKLRGGSRGKTAGKEKFGYMDGGFGTLVSSLEKAIEAKGGIIKYGYTALNLTKEKDNRGQDVFNIGCILEDCSSVVFSAESVITTLSGIRFANMTTSLDIDEKYLKNVFDLRYKSNLCMVLRLKSSLSKYYWTTVCDNSPFIAVIEHTNLVSDKKYGGNVVYLSRYLDISDPLWMQSDSEIYKLFCKGLKKLYPNFRMSDVKDWRLTRTRYSQPVIKTNYSEKMPTVQTPVPGLFLAGMSQIYPEDRGMNYAIRLANRVSEDTVRFLEKKGPQ